jgi:hypothetical protein
MTLLLNAGVALAMIIVAKATPAKISPHQTIIFSIGALKPLLTYKTTAATFK